MIEIPLTGKYADGRQTIVDDDDYDLASEHTWWCSPYGYAITKGRVRGQWRQMHLSRLLLDIVDDSSLHVDHINRNRLDNRRTNLRAVDPVVNRQNTNGRHDSRSGVRGVHWDSRRQRWRARIMLDGQRHELGWFQEVNGAALAIEAFRAEQMPWVFPDRHIKT